MNTLKLLVLGLILCLATPGITSELIHNFANPSFSGSGYSTHVLSLEQLRYSRENKVKDDAKSAAAAALSDFKNPYDTSKKAVRPTKKNREDISTSRPLFLI